MERRIGRRPQPVLVADDSPDLRELWRLWLTSWGFAVTAARDGWEAVEKAQRNKPDLILMDLWMPRLDGLQAIQRLKDNPSTVDVPIIALSAQLECPNPQAVLAAGAEAFIPKPCDPHTLIEQIRTTMGRLRTV
jgi:CheY-like chemotaxis protein